MRDHYGLRFLLIVIPTSKNVTTANAIAAAVLYISNDTSMCLSFVVMYSVYYNLKIWLIPVLPSAGVSYRKSFLVRDCLRLDEVPVRERLTIFRVPLVEFVYVACGSVHDSIITSLELALRATLLWLFAQPLCS
jgi:hypothetical protein